MNHRLLQLQPYPFERLARLFDGVSPPEALSPIRLSIGEPQHPVPPAILESLVAHLDRANQYPSTRGLPELRIAIAEWLKQRFRLPSDAIDPERHILPCSGTREALFSMAQALLPAEDAPLVLMPNPFYQIYEGAALLAGGEPYFLNTTDALGQQPDFEGVPESVWSRCRLIYLCSPGNPSGAVVPRSSLKWLIECAQRHQFIVAADECYSELYRDESAPPPGLLEVAQDMGLSDFSRLLVFHSLSKRSNMPGLRSGFVAGDAELIRQFFLYRTYHGAALPLPIQAASVTAWSDETHVRENRARYREKFAAVVNRLNEVLPMTIPEAGFYLWPQLPSDDQAFTRALFEKTHVTVLPGSFLSRDAHGINPGHRHIRIALVPPLEACVEAAERIRQFIQTQPTFSG